MSSDFLQSERSYSFLKFSFSCWDLKETPGIERYARNMRDQPLLKGSSVTERLYKFERTVALTIRTEIIS